MYGDRGIFLYTINNIPSCVFNEDILYVALQEGPIEARLKKTGDFLFQMRDKQDAKAITLFVLRSSLFACVEQVGVELWNLEKKLRVRVFEGTGNSYVDARQVITSSQRTMRIWNLPSGDVFL